MMVFTRLVTGVLSEKPVFYVFIATIILTFVIAVFLGRLKQQVFTHTIPDLYRTAILPSRHTENNWQWNYFMMGTAALAVTFAPLAARAFSSNDSVSSGDTSGSSCSSCGSSCSSSGGCGGGD